MPRKFTGRIRLIFSIAAVLTAIFIVIVLRQQERIHVKKSQVRNARSILNSLRLFLVNEVTFFEDDILVCPEGDLTSLENWMLLKTCHDKGADGKLGRALAAWSPSAPAGGRLRDVWGNPLVYRYPAMDDQHLFTLYSIGPNGRDDRRRGDDIDVSVNMDYVRDLTGIDSVNSDWVYRHRGLLRRVLAHDRVQIIVDESSFK